MTAELTPNLANIRLWHEALLNPDNRQTTGSLRDADGMCCLGVACEVAMAHGVEVARVEQPGSWTYNDQEGVLPVVVQDWLGVSTNDPLLTTGWTDEGEPEEATASDLNDNHEASFVEIAACIKHTWPEAFSQDPEKAVT